MNYNNRRNGCVPCQKKQPEPTPKEDKVEVVVPIEPEKTNSTLETVQCGKKILSITEVNNKVIVMYDDCSYSVTDKELVHIGLNKPKVISITEANGKVVITLDNGTYLEAELSAVDTSLNADIGSREELDVIQQKIKALEDKPDNDTIFDPTELQDRLTKAEAVLEILGSNLEDVLGLEGEVLFKAFNKNTNLTN